MQLTVIIPALNEEGAIGATVAEVRDVVGDDTEILVVDDGSTDNTAAEAAEAGARVLRHATNIGYSRSLKDGIHAASNDIVAIIDADLTYPAAPLKEMYERLVRDGFDMVTGVRSHGLLRHGLHKFIARATFRWMCEFATGQRIPDINSGLRVFRRELARPFWSFFGHGYSFTTTITLLALLYGYAVGWQPIEYRVRHGHSKVRFFRDSLRAAQVLVETLLVHNPIKIFLLLSAAVFVTGLASGVVGFMWWAPLMPLAPVALVGSVVILALGFAVSALRPRVEIIHRTPVEWQGDSERT